MSSFDRQPVVLHQLKDNTNIIRHILMTNAIQFEYTSGVINVVLNVSDVLDLNTLPFQLSAINGEWALALLFKIMVNDKTVYSKDYDIAPNLTRTFSFLVDEKSSDLDILEIITDGTLAVPVTNPPPVAKTLPTEEETDSTRLGMFTYAATLALRSSNDVVMRCYEAGIPLPQEWKDYRNTLRVCETATAINSSSELPNKPALPPEI